jgi:hypothetical protein
MEIKKLYCPWCGAAADRATDPKSILDGDFTLLRQRPGPGAICACIVCANISQYSKDDMLVKLSPKQLEDLKKEDPSFFAELEITKSKALQILREHINNKRN